jgi:hypothetical protein
MVSAFWINDLAWVNGVETTDEFTGDVAGELIYHGYQKKSLSNTAQHFGQSHESFTCTF